MINLLPSSYKNELLQEEKWKIILNLEIFLFASLICLSLILLAVKISVAGLDRAQQILTESEKKTVQLEKKRTGVLGIENLEKEIKEINDKLSKLKSFYGGEPNLTRVLQKLSEILPSGSYLTGFSYQKETSQINLSGFCQDRERIFKLKENLESEEDFKELYFPSSNWLSPQNFNLSFKIK